MPERRVIANELTEPEVERNAGVIELCVRPRCNEARYAGRDPELGVLRVVEEWKKTVAIVLRGQRFTIPGPTRKHAVGAFVRSRNSVTETPCCLTPRFDLLERASAEEQRRSDRLMQCAVSHRPR